MKVLHFFIPILLFLSFFTILPVENVKAYSGDLSEYDNAIWFFSDIHVDYSNDHRTWFKNALNDSSNLSWDIALFSGDMCDGDSGYFDDYVSYLENYSAQYIAGWNGTRLYPIDNHSEVFYHIAGNHEDDGDADRSNFRSYIHWFPDNSTLQRYNFTFGNIMVIGISESTDAGKWYVETCWDWFNTTVQANQDKNIIVFTHPPVNLSGTAGSYDTSAWSTVPLVWLTHNYNISLIVHGHIHAPLENPYMFADESAWEQSFAPCCTNLNFSNCSFLNDGCIIHDEYGPPNPDGNSYNGDYSESFYLALTQGSRTAVLRGRNHTGESWSEGNYSWINLTLNHAWDNGSVPGPAPNIGPNISAVFPLNNSINVPRNITQYNFTVYDKNGDLINYSFTNLDLCGHLGDQDGVPNGTYNITLPLGCLPLDCNTTYNWTVNVTDGLLWTNYSFTFRTEDCNITRICVEYTTDMTDVQPAAISMFTIVGVFLTIGAIGGIALIVGKHGMI